MLPVVRRMSEVEAAKHCRCLVVPQAEAATEMDPLITVEDALGDLDPRDG